MTRSRAAARRVSLVGQSAGAHLTALLLVQLVCGAPAEAKSAGISAASRLHLGCLSAVGPPAAAPSCASPRPSGSAAWRSIGSAASQMRRRTDEEEEQEEEEEEEGGGEGGWEGRGRRVSMGSSAAAAVATDDEVLRRIEWRVGVKRRAVKRGAANRCCVASSGGSECRGRMTCRHASTHPAHISPYLPVSPRISPYLPISPHMRVSPGRTCRHPGRSLQA